jgi:hypothetical protein
LRDRRCYPSPQGGHVMRAALFLGPQQIEQIIGPRQTTNVGDEYSVGTNFQGILLAAGAIRRAFRPIPAKPLLSQSSR